MLETAKKYLHEYNLIPISGNIIIKNYKKSFDRSSYKHINKENCLSEIKDTHNTIAIIPKNNNLVVLDIDNLDDWEHFKNKYNIKEPNTVKEKTNKGTHYYFKISEEQKGRITKNITKVKESNIDIIFNTLIFMTPSSYMKGGKKIMYSWYPEYELGKKEFQTVPEWILELYKPEVKENMVKVENNFICNNLELNEMIPNIEPAKSYDDWRNIGFSMIDYCKKNNLDKKEGLEKFKEYSMKNPGNYDSIDTENQWNTWWDSEYEGRKITQATLIMKCTEGKIKNETSNYIKEQWNDEPRDIMIQSNDKTIVSESSKELALKMLINCTCDGNTIQHNIQRDGYYLYCKKCFKRFPIDCKKEISQVNYPEMSRYLNITIVNGNIINNYNTKEESDESKFFKLRKIMLDISKKNNYKKLNGNIYKPQKDNCYVYEMYKNYSSFLEEIFEENVIFNSSTTMFSNCMLYLEKRNEKDLPNIEKDLNWIAFKNGSLEINTCEFTENKNLNIGICARQFINLNLDIGNLETPLFDNLVMYQLQDHILYEYLLFFIGRLFFKVKERDNYQIMFFLKGLPNTGKSTILNIIKAMFDKSSSAVLSANQEQIFGLSGMYDKELIVISDVPKNISSILNETLLQDMISGNGVNIPRKNEKAETINWPVQICGAGNYYLDYPDEHGAMSRRIAYFKIEKVVMNKDTKLEDKIIKKELTKLIYKSLVTYKNMLEKYGEKDFWDFCPTYFKDTKEDSKSTDNYIYKFLNDVFEINGNKTYIKYQTNSMEKLEDVRKLYEEYMKNYKNIKYKFSKENIAWTDLGYDIKYYNICKSCMTLAKPGCCDNYSVKNRLKKDFILHLKIVSD